MSGEFTVANKSNPSQNKYVKVKKNVVITNYNGNTMPANGLKVDVKDGKAKITGSTSDNKQIGNLRSADMASYKYTVFENLMKLDKNPSDLSQKDLDLVSTSMEGVKQVRRDKEAGVTTIVFDNGEILKFDFETDAEKAKRLKTENHPEEKVKPENNKEVQKLSSKSTLEQGLSAFIGLFAK